MNLYLLRHAIAAERGTSDYGSDAERPLTDEGVAKMRRLARSMKALGLEFEAIVSSPYLRARQTAEVVAKVLGWGEPVLLTPLLAPDGDRRELVSWLNRDYGEGKGVMLVGHEPYLSELASVLSAGTTTASLDMRKGGLCWLTANGLRYGQCATLRWLLPPKVLGLVR